MRTSNRGKFVFYVLERGESMDLRAYVHAALRRNGDNWFIALGKGTETVEFENGCDSLGECRRVLGDNDFTHDGALPPQFYNYTRQDVEVPAEATEVTDKATDKVAECFEKEGQIVSHYCVCMLRWPVGSVSCRFALDVVTFPNPNKVPRAIHDTRLRALSLRKAFGYTDGAGQTLRATFGIPEGARVEVVPVILREISE